VSGLAGSERIWDLDGLSPDPDALGARIHCPSHLESLLHLLLLVLVSRLDELVEEERLAGAVGTRHGHNGQFALDATDHPDSLFAHLQSLPIMLNKRDCHVADP